MNYTKIILFLSFLIFCSCSKKKYELKSPNENLIVNLSNQNGLFLDAEFNGKKEIQNSKIGIYFDKIEFSGSVKLQLLENKLIDDKWQTVNGKFKSITTQSQEYTFKLEKSGKECILVFRIFDDGFAYKYKLETSTKINKDLASIGLSGDYRIWAFNGERHNKGPIKSKDLKTQSFKTPVLIETQSKIYMSIHEAEVLDFAPFNVVANNSNIEFSTNFTKREGKFETSWKVFLFAQRAGELIESNVITSLNKTCAIKNTDWIKPGKALWDWRVNGYKAKDGFVYGLNTESQKRFIDFAKANGISYFLLDANWYGNEHDKNSDPTTSEGDVKISETLRYAKEQGVGVILYLNDIGAKRFGLENVLRTFNKWGAVGVKYGFMKGNPEQKVKHTRKVVELCAKYKLMVDFHDGPIIPSGDRRTWPNLITKEFGHAQADAKRTSMPETAVNTTYINMIAGPLDLTNGWFDLNNAHSRYKVFKELFSTVSAEVAKLIVTYTGWMVLPDAPEEYINKSDLFECIKKMPNQFDSIKFLQGEVDEYISVARKTGNDWFVGTLNNRSARTIKMKFDFLESGCKYKATFYADTKDSDFEKNKEAYQIYTKKLDANSVVDIYLANGGGCSIHLEKLN
jgi:alpha-glucosidase